jgi:hypothetical protein
MLILEYEALREVFDTLCGMISRLGDTHEVHE